mmetsp:Transcript_9080/g.32080  ORF Transcript_9080/g.32080 Transcript_9080/m.32080 type:complete len:378 (-) Transcript_9080:12-1145(-)
MALRRSRVDRAAHLLLQKISHNARAVALAHVRRAQVVHQRRVHDLPLLAAELGGELRRVGHGRVVLEVVGDTAHQHRHHLRRRLHRLVQARLQRRAHAVAAHRVRHARLRAEAVGDGRGVLARVEGKHLLCVVDQDRQREQRLRRGVRRRLVQLALDGLRQHGDGVGAQAQVARELGGGRLRRLALVDVERVQVAVELHAHGRNRRRRHRRARLALQPRDRAAHLARKRGNVALQRRVLADAALEQEAAHGVLGHVPRVVVELVPHALHVHGERHGGRGRRGRQRRRLAVQRGNELAHHLLAQALARDEAQHGLQGVLIRVERQHGAPIADVHVDRDEGRGRRARGEAAQQKQCGDGLGAHRGLGGFRRDAATLGKG